MSVLAALGLPGILCLVGVFVGLAFGIGVGCYMARVELRAASVTIRTLRDFVWSCEACTPKALAVGYVPVAPAGADRTEPATPAHFEGR